MVTVGVRDALKQPCNMDSDRRSQRYCMKTIRLITICLLALIAPEASLAHSPIQGIGDFYNGLLHPLLVPAHLLLLVAVGLFLGQQETRKLELVLGTYVAAIVVGLTGAWFSIGTGMETWILAVSAIIGLLVAARFPSASWWSLVVVLLAGFLLGMDSAQNELVGKNRLAALFGSAIAIYFLVLYPMALAEYCNRKPWQRIGIRVIGSWVTASSLLVLALSLSSVQ